MATASMQENSSSHARLPQNTAFFMLGIVGLTYAVNAMDRVMFPILLPNVNKQFGFSLEQGGFLATVFTLGIGLSGIPTGFLLDRVSRMSVILIGIAVYSVLTILSAFSVGFYDAAAYRALSGVGEGMQNAALFTAVGAYFASSRAATLGSMNFAYGIGSFIGPALAAYILVWTHDWRAPLEQIAGRLGQAARVKMLVIQKATAFCVPAWTQNAVVTYGVLGLVMMVVARLTVRSSFTEQRNGTTSLATPAARDRIPPSVLNRNVVICALSAVTLGVSGYGFLGLYPTFLRTELGFSVPQAGFAASLFGLGALFGIPANWVADRFNQRWMAIVATLVMLVNSHLMLNVARIAAAQDALALVFGGVGSGAVFVSTYSLIQRCVQPQLIGRASGVMVTFLYLPASIAGYLFAVPRNQLG